MFSDTARVPPVTALCNLACYSCFKEETEDLKLKRCSACKRISFCSTQCQSTNWPRHKKFCKAFRGLETDTVAKLALTFSINEDPTDHQAYIANHCEAQTENKIGFCSRSMGRPLGVEERNLLGWEPRCLACIRTDQDLRLTKDEGQQLKTLYPCPACKLSFFCCTAHQEKVQHSHRSLPNEDGHDGLSQCALNKEVLQNVQFANTMDAANPGPFQWAPDRVKGSWVSLEGSTWDAEFGKEIAKSFNLRADGQGMFLRAASEGLHMPLTILWAIEKLSKDDRWQTKDTLNIHILGAHQKEAVHASMFEEILHRLPQVKTLKLLMCGPEMKSLLSGHDQEMDMDTCLNCRKDGRRRIQCHQAETYHAFVRKQANAYDPPDLAIAFNSGMSESSGSWKPTVELLTKRKIPTIFTSFNKEEAGAEAKILSGFGVNEFMLREIKNPWGSILLRTEPNKVAGFYACSAWVAGAFC